MSEKELFCSPSGHLCLNYPNWINSASIFLQVCSSLQLFYILDEIYPFCKKQENSELHTLRFVFFIFYAGVALIEKPRESSKDFFINVYIYKFRDIKHTSEINENRAR